MDFEYAITKSSADYVLRRLRSEAQGAVIASLSELLVAHQARALAEQCFNELPRAEQEVKDVRSKLGEAEKGVKAAKAELDKAEAEAEVARKTRGLGEHALLAHGEAVKQRARLLDDAESVVRSLSHDLRRSEQKVRNLNKLVEGLGSYSVPNGDVLPLLAEALGVNGNG